MNLEAKALKDMMNIKADIYTVFDLLKNNEFSREVVYHDSDSGITTVYSADGVLGSRWGEFYSSDFYRRGIRGYTYAFGEGTACPADLSIDAETLYPVTIKLYTNISSDSAQGFNRANMIALLGSSTDMSEYDLTSEYTIMISGNDYDDLLSASVSEALSARGPMNADLSSLLQYSLNYIDYDYSTLSDSIERIETEGIRFPLLDFLYYSAITITTTGYGDILPNSSLVRAIVMLEAFIGIAIPGVFISLLFFKIDFNPERRKDV
ncbi:MAG: two pore domain potassium channel family protein [Clostridiales bacterium]|nr:two pore domain potassium channel family protein [Clostridiales bacterium]